MICPFMKAVHYGICGATGTGPAAADSLAAVLAVGDRKNLAAVRPLPAGQKEP
jgi:hypothetical protein